MQLDVGSEPTLRFAHIACLSIFPEEIFPLGGGINFFFPPPLDHGLDH